MIPYGSMILGKLKEYDFFHKEREFGIVLHEEKDVPLVIMGVKSYMILYNDGSRLSEYEDYIRLHYEVLE